MTSKCSGYKNACNEFWTTFTQTITVTVGHDKKCLISNCTNYLFSCLISPLLDLGWFIYQLGWSATPWTCHAGLGNIQICYYGSLSGTGKLSGNPPIGLKSLSLLFWVIMVKCYSFSWPVKNWEFTFYAFDLFTLKLQCMICIITDLGM